MQHLTWRDVMCYLPQPFVLRGAVHFVAHERMADMVEVHPNLMRAARMQKYFDKCGAS